MNKETLYDKHRVTTNTCIYKRLVSGPSFVEKMSDNAPPSYQETVGKLKSSHRIRNIL